MHLVLTGCTNRKRVRAADQLRAAGLRRGPLPIVAEDWGSRLTSVDRGIQAKHLYAGRGFQEAVAAAAHIGANLVIVSAGLGLIEADRMVPSYALSVSEGTADAVLARLSDGANSCDWWRAVSAISPFSRPLHELVAASSGVIIVALSEAYLAMVAEDFRVLAPADAARVRLVTRAPAYRIAPFLHDRLMPYDDRLDGPDSPLRGTRGDFAGRAAHHFVREIVAVHPNGSAVQHSEAVSASLAGLSSPPIYERTRLDDDRLAWVIRENWDKAGGQSTKLLRLLRDDLNIACEQGRFLGLVRRVRGELEAAA
jgi:hypothetical protein